MKNNFEFGSFDEMERKITAITEDIPEITADTVGESIFGRKIYKLSFGSGEKTLVLAAGFDGTTDFGSMLLNFLWEFSEMKKRSLRVFNTNPKYVSTCRKIVVYPLLNPDGCEYRISGVSENNPIRTRLIDMNDRSEDFSSWRANGRGVSLDRNSPYGFRQRKLEEEKLQIYNGSPSYFSGNTPCSEPELSAFFDAVESEPGIRAVVCFSSFGEEGNMLRSCRAVEKISGCARLGRSIARIGRARYRESMPKECAVVDYIGESMRLPAYSFFSTNPDYEQHRELLYTLPLLV